MRRKRFTPPIVIPEERETATRTITRAELAMRVRAVELLMNQGAGELHIAQYCQENWKRGRKYAVKLMERVRQRCIHEMEKERPAWKALQIRRLHNMLTMSHSALSNPKTPASEKTRHFSLLLQTEKLLADVTGTKEPLKVDVGSSQLEAVGKIMATLSADQFAAALEQHAEEKELAQKARVVLRLGDGTTVEEDPDRLRRRT